MGGAQPFAVFRRVGILNTPTLGKTSQGWGTPAQRHRGTAFVIGSHSRECHPELAGLRDSLQSRQLNVLIYVGHQRRALLNLYVLAVLDEPDGAKEHRKRDHGPFLPLAFAAFGAA